MFIRLYLIYLTYFISEIFASCPYIRSSVILTGCVFDTNPYLSLGAHLIHSNSIDFLGHYSFNHTEGSISETLIYNLNNRWMLLLPLLLKCSHQSIPLIFTECQYTMRQVTMNSKLSSITEYMTTHLTVMNMTDLGMQSVLFLQPGEITLRSCKAYDCSKQLVYLTASNETFHFRINYEKAIGTKCQVEEDCRHQYAITDLIHCDQYSQTCQCFDENIMTFDLPGIGRLCTDSIDRSNCTEFPQRCLQWCDQSATSYCLCPKSTRKVKRINGVFDCELEPRGICRFADDDPIGMDIRKCPTGTICDGYRCRSLTRFRQMYGEESTTLKSDSISSTIKDKTTNFIRILIAITLVSLFLFILILFWIFLLFKSNRCHFFTSSSEDKVSSFSFGQSTSTDLYNEIYQFKPSNDYSRRYENSSTVTNSTFLPGLVPQTNLSPRFHRQTQRADERRRQTPLYIQSPTLSYIDQGLLTTNRAMHLPTVTHLQNGDVLISA